MKKFLLLFFSLPLIFSCSKESNEPQKQIDENPIKINAIAPLQANKDRLIFAAEVLYLNDEKIESYGFVFLDEYGSFPEKEYVMSKALGPGKISFELPDFPSFDFNTVFGYYFFIKTDKQHYKSNIQKFQFSEITVNAQYSLQAKAGEEIVIKGDFEKLDNTYVLYDSYNMINEVAFTLKDKYTMSFIMPENYKHGETLNFILQRKQQTDLKSIGIASVKVLGEIFPPANYNMIVSDRLTLTGRSLSSGVQIIIGNRSVAYYNNLALQDLIFDQSGDSFQIGYFNGRDRVIFPEKIKLMRPLSTNFRLAESYAHPNTRAIVEGLTFDNYLFGYKASIGIQGTHILTTWDGIKSINIGNIKEGSYPIVIKSPFFDLVTESKVEVQNLKVTSINKDIGYRGDKFILKGNFLPSQSYFAFVGDAYSFVTVNKLGEATLINDNMIPGKLPVRVGYHKNGFPDYETQATDFFIETKKGEILDFYPKQAKIGDIIKVKGRGLYISSLLLGSTYIYNVLNVDDGFEFTIPYLMPKGKFYINIISGPTTDKVTSKQFIEII
ncbi:hypothetical protein [Sphingobacterium hungaricum]|uniref:IPT/TIG domain-containing protein n=1 Tax=Sphingobacterium hungaricum TaxID=2082723 RepID=A0A928YNN3_9SPHI|nr:hypothetical protein [Sphingobacterium hungaricum]MBE8712079.1 hypothetical protein [Sphingobacterium hungaricum]